MTRRAKPKTKPKRHRLHWRHLLKIAGLWLGGLVALAIIAVAGLWFWAGGDKTPPDQIAWGLTYSSGAAEGLGLDSAKTYRAILDELHPQRLRLIAYWNVIEPTVGTYNFSDLDSQVRLAEERGIPYILVVGRKVPRWPECHTPAWAKSQPMTTQHDEILKLIRATVTRYRSNAHLLRWQVENEPYLSFGDGCPGLDENFLRRELELVRGLSTKPLMITDSGETNDWYKASQWTESFGSTLYRAVLNPKGGTFHHFLTPSMYTHHANLIKKLHPNVKQVIVAELQAEPWTNVGLKNISPAYRDRTLSHQQFDDNTKFAEAVGFDEVYYWGAEWWYYQKLQGDSYYWDAAAKRFR